MTLAEMFIMTLVEIFIMTYIEIFKKTRHLYSWCPSELAALRANVEFMWCSVIGDIVTITST